MTVQEFLSDLGIDIYKEIFADEKHKYSIRKYESNVAIIKERKGEID